MNDRRMQEYDVADFDIIPDRILDPNYYMDLTIRLAILAPHRALTSGNDARAGILSLIVAVDQLERLARARKVISDDDDYANKVKEYEASVKQRERDELLQKALIANYKLQLIVEKIFETLGKKGELII